MEFLGNVTPAQWAGINQLGQAISALGAPYMDPTAPRRGFIQGLAGVPGAVRAAEREEAAGRRTEAIGSLIDFIRTGGAGRAPEAAAGAPPDLATDPADPAAAAAGLRPPMGMPPVDPGTMPGADPMAGPPGPAGGGLMPGVDPMMGGLAGPGYMPGGDPRMEALLAEAFPEIYAKAALGRIFSPPGEAGLHKLGPEDVLMDPTGRVVGRGIGRDPLEDYTSAEKEAVRMFGSLEDPRAQDYVRESRLGREDRDVKLSDINALAGAYQKETADFFQARIGMEKVREAAALGTAVGDVALVFGLMKVIDPRSTVREGEAATIENARGVGAALRQEYNRLLTGERMRPDQRRQIVEAAESQFRPYVSGYLDTERHYKQRARRHGFDVRDIVTDRFGALRKDFAETGAAAPGPRGAPRRLRYNPATGRVE
jgi:hypothetical protein